MGDISIALAFTAGLASFLSPCVFPIIPAYLGYLSGYSSKSFSKAADKNPYVFINGLVFILGFSFVFIVLGVIFSLLGGSATIIRIAAGKIGGFIVIIMGLKLLNIINIPFLDYEKRLDTQPDKYQPLLSSFVLGVIFSAGWSPCIGPVLGSILMIVLNHGDLQVGIILLTSYSLGLAIPFIILSLFWDSVFKYLKRIAIVTRYIDLISGIILVIIGIMLILGLFQQLSSFGTFLNL